MASTKFFAHPVRNTPLMFPSSILISICFIGCVVVSSESRSVRHCEHRIKVIAFKFGISMGGQGRAQIGHLHPDVHSPFGFHGENSMGFETGNTVPYRVSKCLLYKSRQKLPKDYHIFLLDLRHFVDIQCGDNVARGRKANKAVRPSVHPSICPSVQSLLPPSVGSSNFAFFTISGGDCITAPAQAGG